MDKLNITKGEIKMTVICAGVEKCEHDKKDDCPHSKPHKVYKSFKCTNHMYCSGVGCRVNCIEVKNDK